MLFNRKKENSRRLRLEIQIVITYLKTKNPGFNEPRVFT